VHTQTANHLKVVAQFIQGTRPMGLCKRQLRDFYLAQIIKFKTLDNSAIKLLLRVLLQNHHATQVALSLELKSPKEVEQSIREIYGSIFSQG
jgi:DNA-directed RNA polymerase specialized sigma54-like protein